MDHLSARRQRLWEAMDACRNGSDLSDPQFADLAAELAIDAELRRQLGLVKAEPEAKPAPPDAAPKPNAAATARR